MAYENMSELVKQEAYWRDRNDPRERRSYHWGVDYGKDLLRDINEMAHTAGVGAIEQDILKRAFREIKELRATRPDSSRADEAAKENP